MSSESTLKILSTIVLIFSTVTLAQPLMATSFTISDGEVVNTQQNLGDYETGIIREGGELNTETGLSINVTGRNAFIENEGVISTIGTRVIGIQSSGYGTTINNVGSIISESGLGIYLTGDSADISNSGSINTTEDFGRGIVSLGSNTTITHSGSIVTTGIVADAVFLGGDNVNFTGSGSITTQGSYSDGIESVGDNVIISHSGRIVTYRAYGIASSGDNTIIENHGYISTMGIAIGLRGTNITFRNSGTLAGGAYSSADRSRGVYSSANNATIYSNGDISAFGFLAYGIWSVGEGVKLTNDGTISTLGNNSIGILVSSDSVLTNSGSISILGYGATGVELGGSYSVFNNSGSVTVTGDYGLGIRLYGQDVIVNNSGLISATGTSHAPIAYRGVLLPAPVLGASSSYAIWGSSNNITLNLLPGSQILGRIDLGGDGTDLDTVNIYGNGGASASTSLTFENTEVVNLFGVNGFSVGDSVVTVDPTGESTRGVSLAKVTSAIHNVINQRMAHTTPLAPSRVASRTFAPGMLFRERKPVAWIQAFGGESERDSEGSALEYEHDYQGVTLGYEMDYEGYRLGLMGGVVHSETETDIDSFETESDSYYLGGYGHFELGSVSITTTLLGGYSDNDNKRIVWDNLNGREAAKSDFDGLFLSPSVTLSAAYAMNNHLELRPSASLNYSVTWLDSYSEHGTTGSNLKVDDRTARAFSSRLQLAAAYRFTQYSEVEFRVGMDSRHTDDDDVDVNLAGSNFRYAATGDEDVAGGYAGLNLRFNSSENLSLIADVERGNASGDEDSFSGHLTLEYRF